MIATKRLPKQFLITLSLTLIFGFGLHVLVLEYLGEPLFGNMLVPSYAVNFVLAAVIFIALYMLRQRLKNALGFLFMAGSLLKFVVFFLLFYPTFKADGVMHRLEFAAFFVPYLIALVLETFFASKMLNKAQ